MIAWDRAKTLALEHSTLDLSSLRNCAFQVPVEKAPELEGYTIIETAGRGSFGAVYRAWDEKLEREVAVKVLFPGSHASHEMSGRMSGRAVDLGDRLLNEARALARVRHANVPTIYSVIDAADQRALVTEFVDGEPLSEHVEDYGPVASREAARIGVELCRALAAIHEAGIVHRDLKSSNILLARGRRVVLTDFGLSVFVDEQVIDSRRRYAAGSPFFMAPEQARGRQVSVGTDIYGLGGVLYNLTTGSYPVLPQDFEDLVARLEAGDLIPLDEARPDLDPAFTRIVTKALARRPGARFQSAAEFGAALERFLWCAG